MAEDKIAPQGDLKSEVKRLSFAEMQMALTATRDKQEAPKVHGSIALERGEDGGLYFMFTVPVDKMEVDKHVAWKESVVMRNGKPSRSLRGTVCLAAEMPTGLVLPMSLADGTVKKFRVIPNNQYGAGRYINFTVDPVAVEG